MLAQLVFAFCKDVAFLVDYCNHLHRGIGVFGRFALKPCKVFEVLVGIEQVGIHDGCVDAWEHLGHIGLESKGVDMVDFPFAVEVGNTVDCVLVVGRTVGA